VGAVRTGEGRMVSKLEGLTASLTKAIGTGRWDQDEWTGPPVRRILWLRSTSSRPGSRTHV
jgi:hypothetical protein